VTIRKLAQKALCPLIFQLYLVILFFPPNSLPGYPLGMMPAPGSSYENFMMQAGAYLQQFYAQQNAAKNDENNDDSNKKPKTSKKRKLPEDENVISPSGSSVKSNMFGGISPLNSLHSTDMDMQFWDEDISVVASNSGKKMSKTFEELPTKKKKFEISPW